MNPQIQKLADKAGLFVDLGGESWPRAMAAEESVIVYQKFAELIVRECAEVASAPLAFTDAAYCRVGLLKHFGVEE